MNTVSVSFKSVLLFCFVMVLSTMSAQTGESDLPRDWDIAPAWPGCNPKMPDCTKARLDDFVASNLQLPAEAKQAGGVVLMEFIIEKTGMVGPIKPMHDPGMGMGAEATRVLELLNIKKIRFIPAEKDGKKVAYKFVLPIKFNATPEAKVKKATEVPAMPKDGIYDVVDIMPRYAGCGEAKGDSIDCTFRKMLSHVRTNLKYPDTALVSKVSGQVVVQFVVNEQGQVTKPEILQGIGHGCDEEALRVISLMPAWIPGVLDGKTVPVRMKLPILFQLPKVKEEE